MLTFTILSILTFIYLNYKVYKLGKPFNPLDLSFLQWVCYFISGVYTIIIILCLWFKYLP